MHEEELLNGWIPYRLLTDESGSVQFRWMYVGNHSFREPFFEETIGACLSLPENGMGSFPVTGSETLLNVAARVQSVQPTGFIYHISRCGSTLISQMLSCDPQCIVLSEVPLLDQLMRLPLKNKVVTNHFVKELFNAVLILLGQKKNKTESRLFVKTDSWHVLFHDQLVEWYPDVPSFLMYRNPREVAASHKLAPAMHAVPGLIEPVLFGLDTEDAVQMHSEEYLEHVLCCYLRKYESILQSKNRVAALDYHSGVWQMLEDVFTTCGYRPTDSSLAVMKQRASFHSKKPDAIFAGDTDRQLQRDLRASEKLFDLLQDMNHPAKQVM